MPRTGQAGINQLGGLFVNGRPLPGFIRRRIVELAELGVRPCDISRQLLVSHGCVSKILSRYYETGSISPGSQTGGRAKSLAPLVIKKIQQIRNENPMIMAKDIREQLIYYRIYQEENAPSLGTICRVLRSTGDTLFPHFASVLAVPPVKGKVSLSLQTNESDSCDGSTDSDNTQ